MSAKVAQLQSDLTAALVLLRQLTSASSTKQSNVAVTMTAEVHAVIDDTEVGKFLYIPGTQPASPSSIWVYMG